ncbi:MAG: hypothetical protein WBO70_06440 [Erysipelotrichaceae bacterium]
MKKYYNKNTLIYTAIAIIISLIMLLFKIKIVDSFFYLTIFTFAIGFVIYCNHKGDFDVLTYKKDLNPSYREYRKELLELKKETPNSILGCSYILLVITICLNFLL